MTTQSRRPHSRMRIFEVAAVVALSMFAIIATPPADGQPARGATCSGRTVPHPALIARQADALLPCWSAFSGGDFVPIALTRRLIIGLPMRCDGADSGVVALDVATGRLVWRAARGLSPDALTSRRGVGSGVLVLSDQSGATVGVNVRTGRSVWKAAAMFPFADGPDFVVTGRKTALGLVLIVLDRKSGHERWQRLDAIDDFPMASAGSHIVLLSGIADTTAYDARTGVKRWTARFGPASDTFAVRTMKGVVTGVSGVGRDANDTLAYDLTRGRLLWTSPATPVQSPEPSDGNFYTVFPDDTLAALAARTGHVRWRLRSNPAGTDHLYAGPGLVLLAQGAAFRGLNPHSGKTLWRVPRASLGLPTGDLSGQLIDVLPSHDGVFFAWGNCLGE